MLILKLVTPVRSAPAVWQIKSLSLKTAADGFSLLYFWQQAMPCGLLRYFQPAQELQIKSLHRPTQIQSQCFQSESPYLP